MLTDGVIEPMKVVTQAIQSATETAAMVLESIISLLQRN